MKVKKISGIFFGVVIFLIFSLNVSAEDIMKDFSSLNKYEDVTKKAVESKGAIDEDKFKDFNFPYEYRDINTKNVKNKRTICELNLYILLKNILKENNILNQNNENEIKENFLYNVFSLDFKNPDKMKDVVNLYSIEIDMINKIDEVFSKTNFKEIKISEEMFKEAKDEFLKYLTDYILKKFRSLMEQKTALEKGEKAIEELYEKYTIEGKDKIEKRLKSGRLTKRDKAQCEEAITIAEEDLKFFDKLKNNLELDNYEKEKKDGLKERAELEIKALVEELLGVLGILKESKNLKYEDVKDIHKNLTLDKIKEQ